MKMTTFLVKLSTESKNHLVILINIKIKSLLQSQEYLVEFCEQYFNSAFHLVNVIMTVIINNVTTFMSHSENIKSK